MGHRLSKITTRTGDDGTTGLADGARVKKTHPRVEAMGAVDELNSVLGLLLTQNIPQNLHDSISAIQQDLFDLGGELSIPGRSAISDTQVLRLEALLESLNRELPPLKEFVLPGGSAAAAVCHVARAVCRRAERCVLRLGESESVNDHSVKYLNRLSDALFVIARTLNRTAGKTEVLWKPGANR